MNAEPFVSRILDDEGLTDGLDEPQAGQLVSWLVRQAEGVARDAKSEAAAWNEIDRLCRRARAVRQFVLLWCAGQDSAAADVAAEEGLGALPKGTRDPRAVLDHFLTAEKTKP